MNLMEPRDIESEIRRREEFKIQSHRIKPESSKHYDCITFPQEEDLLRKLRDKGKGGVEGEGEGDGDKVDGACRFCRGGVVHDCRFRARAASNHGKHSAKDGGNQKEEQGGKEKKKAPKFFLSAQVVHRVPLIARLDWPAVLRRERLARDFRAWCRQQAGCDGQVRADAEEAAFRARPWDRPLKREAAIATHSHRDARRLRIAAGARATARREHIIRVMTKSKTTMTTTTMTTTTTTPTRRRHDAECKPPGDRKRGARELELRRREAAARALREEWAAWQGRFVKPRKVARWHARELLAPAAEAAERQRNEWESTTTTTASERTWAGHFGWRTTNTYFLPRWAVEEAMDHFRWVEHGLRTRWRHNDREGRAKARADALVQFGPGAAVWEQDIDPSCLTCIAKGMHCSFADARLPSEHPDRRRRRRGREARCSRCVRAGGGWCVQLEEQWLFDVYIAGVVQDQSEEPWDLFNMGSYRIMADEYVPLLMKRMPWEEEEDTREAKLRLTWPHEKFPVQTAARGIRLAGGGAAGGKLWAAFVREPGLDEAALRAVADEMLQKVPERVVPGLMGDEARGRGTESPMRPGREATVVYSSLSTSPPSRPSSPSSSLSSSSCSFRTPASSPPSSPAARSPSPSPSSRSSSSSWLSRAPRFAFAPLPHVSPDASGPVPQEWHAVRLEGYIESDRSRPASLPMWNRTGHRAEYQAMSVHKEYFEQLREKRREQVARLEERRRKAVREAARRWEIAELKRTIIAERMAQVGWGWFFRARL